MFPLVEPHNESGHGCTYLESAISETFTLDEANLLREFFASIEPDWKFETKPVGPMPANSAGMDAFGQRQCERLPHLSRQKNGKRRTE